MDHPLKMHFKPFHTDEQLWLIGMIAVLWSYVEGTMDGHIFLLSKALDIESPPDHDSLSFSRRLRLWRRLIRQSPAPQERKAEIEALIDRVAELQPERNQTVHGELCNHPTKGLQLLRIHPERLSYSKPFDTKTLAITVEKIDQLLFDLIRVTVPKSSDLERPPELAGLASPRESQ